MELLLWLIAAYGMTQIIVYGSIFQGFRDNVFKVGESGIPIIGSIFNFINGIISCMMCCSTWVGFFMSYVVYSPFTELMGVNPYLSIFFDGMLASGGVWAINTIVEWFEENRK
jgi:hypothetical protein